jgi:hypothetical protein
MQIFGRKLGKKFTEIIPVPRKPRKSAFDAFAFVAAQLGTVG